MQKFEDPVNQSDETRRVVRRAVRCADEFAAERRSCDPFWNKPRDVHLSLLVQAFADGVLSADPYFDGYRVPPGFEDVLNWLSQSLRSVFNRIGMARLTLLQIRDFLVLYTSRHPRFLQWVNVSASTERGRHFGRRKFIDAESIFQNACLFIERRWKTEEAGRS